MPETVSDWSQLRNLVRSDMCDPYTCRKMTGRISKLFHYSKYKKSRFLFLYQRQHLLVNSATKIKHFEGSATLLEVFISWCEVHSITGDLVTRAGPPEEKNEHKLSKLQCKVDKIVVKV